MVNNAHHFRWWMLRVKRKMENASETIDFLDFILIPGMNGSSEWSRNEKCDDNFDCLSVHVLIFHSSHSFTQLKLYETTKETKILHEKELLQCKMKSDILFDFDKLCVQFSEKKSSHPRRANLQ